MKARGLFSANPKGFTLIEVIVTIVIGAIASVLLIQFMGGNMERSLTPLVRVDRSYELTTVMEKISAEYKRLLLTNADPLFALETHIQTTYGAYAPPLDPSSQLKYIDFNSGNTELDTACSGPGCRFLKVSLVYGEHRLVALFTN